MTTPVSIRMNNPGAINTAPWVREYPGYAGAVETTPGNRTVSFATPEAGVAAWYELLRRYNENGVSTLRGIIYRYCGVGREEEARDYTAFIMNRTGLPGSATVDLGNKWQLLKIAKAFFRYEAGQEYPMSDEAILKGFEMGRRASGKPVGEFIPSSPTLDTPSIPSLLVNVLKALWKVIR